MAMPSLSVVICTRNRGNSVVATIDSVLANTYSNFEVILVDQSDNQETADAIKQFQADQRLIYIHSNTRGLGRSRNIGIAHAQGNIVAFTDDDCTVPTDWLNTVVTLFDKFPRVAIVFSNVKAAPHDETLGFIPCYERHNSVIVRTLWDKCRARGIGASLFVRREAVLMLGGFDEQLGSGALFPSCDDGDLAVRALINHWWIYETHEVAVVHYGFRTWFEGKSLTKRDWYGIGAAYAKPLKCGHWGILFVIFYEAVIKALLQPLSSILYFKKPQGLKRFWYFWLGFFQGLRTPVDQQHMVFKTSNDRLTFSHLGQS